MNLLFGLAALLALGMAAQWLAWRLRVPSILLLLTFGFLAGRDLLNLGIADLIRDDLLFPVVSASVALILFEGGMGLRVADLKKHGRTVMRLISIGALITWVLGTLAAHYVAGLSWELAVLLGAILIVSGPTVVLPVLRQISPRGRTGPILTWEGIAIDPVGAVLAVLVFEGITSPSGWGADTGHAVLGLVMTAAIGGAGGIAGGWLLVQAIKRYLIPDHLHIPMTLASVILVFAATNAAQDECGLLAVTVMGVYAANQRSVAVRHILEFKENLRVLLISSLFLLLASRLNMETLALLDGSAFLFLAVLIFVVRPLAVLICGHGSRLSAKEKLFLAWMCPRGIVAAAVASVFGPELVSAHGLEEAKQLVPLTFLVIVGTVVVYGLTAGPLARRLDLSIANPQGVLFVGAHDWARGMATALRKEEIPVLLVDSNRRNVRKARMEELPARHGNALEEDFRKGLDLFGIGRVLALTPNNEVNTLVSLHFRHDFGRSETYQLAPDTVPAKERTRDTGEMSGRTLFDEQADYFNMSARCARGRVSVTLLTEQFDIDAFLAEHGEGALPLFSITKDGGLHVAAAGQPLEAGPGSRVVALVDKPPAEPTGSESRSTMGL